jgi:hypothetical protein
MDPKPSWPIFQNFQDLVQYIYWANHQTANVGNQFYYAKYVKSILNFVPTPIIYPCMHLTRGNNFNSKIQILRHACIHHLYPSQTFKFLLKLNQTNTLPSPLLTPLPLVENYCSNHPSPLSFSAWKKEEEIHAIILFNTKIRGSSHPSQARHPLIRVQRIYNFLCSMLVFTPSTRCFVTLHGTFMHFLELTY